MPRIADRAAVNQDAIDAPHGIRGHVVRSSRVRRHASPVRQRPRMPDGCARTEAAVPPAASGSSVRRRRANGLPGNSRKLWRAFRGALRASQERRGRVRRGDTTPPRPIRCRNIRLEPRIARLPRRCRNRGRDPARRDWCSPRTSQRYVHEHANCKPGGEHGSENCNAQCGTRNRPDPAGIAGLGRAPHDMCPASCLKCGHIDLLAPAPAPGDQCGHCRVRIG